MNSINKTLIAIMLLAPAVTATAAAPTNTQLRRANLNALRLIEDYESYSAIDNEEAEENFRYIFDNDSTMIYNDLLGLCPDETLTVNDYIDLIKDVNGARIVVKNILAGPVEDNGDKWLMTVYFDKSVEYITPCSAILASEDYYDGTDYKMTAVIEVDKDSYESHIVSLSGSIDSDMPRLEPGFAIAKMNDSRDADVTNNGQKLVFNKFQQAFLSQPYNLEYADDDVKLKIIEDGDVECRKVSFGYQPTRWRVRPYVNIALGGAVKVDAPSGIDESASNIDFGVDFGYVLPSKGKFKIGIFAGLGISNGKIDLSAESINYNYSAGADADMDGDTYVRYYELGNVKQSMKMSYFSVPIYADFEYRFSKSVAGYAQLGLKTYFNMGSKSENHIGSIYSYGVYPQYDNLQIDEPWLNDFGHYSDQEIQAENPFKGFAADILFGLGARIKVVGPLSVDLGFNFNPAIADKLDSTGEVTALPTGNTSIAQAPVTYTVAGGQVAHNPLSQYCKIKRNPLSLRIGLTFKF